MTIPYRGHTSESTYFVTASTHSKHHLLQSERTALLFVDVLYHYRARDRYLLHEFVLMPVGRSQPNIVMSEKPIYHFSSRAEAPDQGQNACKHFVTAIY